MQKLYATSILRLIDKGMGEKEVVDNLLEHLKRSGRTKLLPGILRELKTLAAREKVTAPTLEVARKEDEAQAKAAAKAEGIEAEEVIVNPSLLQGWRARAGSKLVDRSGKRALIDLYARIVK